MSSPPFDPDATVEDARSPRAAGLEVGAFRGSSAAAPPAAPSDDFGDGGGDLTVRDPLPAPLKDELPVGRRPAERRRRVAPPTGDTTVTERRPDYIQPCANCRELIDARKVLCPRCGKPTGKRAINAGLVALIGGGLLMLLVLYLVWDWLGTTAPPAP
jgi:hypothetical protein